MADAQIFKTIQFISKWMHAVEARSSEGDEGVWGEGQGCEGAELNDAEMIRFIKTLKAEMAKERNREKENKESDDFEIIDDSEVTKESKKINSNSKSATNGTSYLSSQLSELDEESLFGHSPEMRRKRADSTFQTIKYIARCIKSVDKHAHKSHISLEDIEEDEENNDKEFSEQDMLNFFKSFTMKNENKNSDGMVEDKGHDNEQIVLNTVEFIKKWMNDVERKK